METIWWGSFFALVILLLALDLGMHRKSHEIGVKEALLWSAFWISLALLFNVFLYFTKGKQVALEFLAGYLIEKSLSVDNLFVFLLIFSFFSIPGKYQHKVLYWGILGALFFRAVFVFAGVALLHMFHWVLYVFGAILIFSAIKLALEKDKEIHPDQNPVLKLFKRFYPISHKLEGEKFFTVEAGIRKATPLFVALLAIETSDIIFAVDSIPAVIAITHDPFIIYSSNVFAILGLRALYFALAGLMRLFHWLHYGLAAILFFVGVKMIIADWYHIPIYAALLVIISILFLSVVLSLMIKEKKAK